MISLNAAIWRTFSAYIYRITRRSLRSNFCLHARTQVSKAPAIAWMMEALCIVRWFIGDTQQQTLTKCVVVWCCGCCFEYPQLQHLTKCVVVWCCGCCFECDGTRKLHLLYSRVWSTVLAYNYVVIVTCTRYRSCIDIAYKWREGLGLECCARIHVFSNE